MVERNYVKPEKQADSGTAPYCNFSDDNDFDLGKREARISPRPEPPIVVIPPLFEDWVQVGAHKPARGFPEPKGGRPLAEHPPTEPDMELRELWRIPPISPPLTADQQREVKKNIALLGDEDFDTRELASKRLAEVGPRALTLLQPALNSTDPEVKLRARHIHARFVEPKIDVAQFVDPTRDPFGPDSPPLDTKAQLQQIKSLPTSRI